MQSDMSIPPGEFLAEVIDELGISQLEFAHRTGIAHQTIDALIRGHKSITSKLALSLDHATGVSEDIWLGLENDYRLALTRRKA